MAIRQKMYHPKNAELKPEWRVVNADGKTLGRLSSEIATILQGKHRAVYVPYLNTGDYVVVINAEKIRVTGSKLEQKKYYRHSGYPGGIKSASLKRLREAKPEALLEKAVKGMLPRNPLGRAVFRKLKVYAGDTHPHGAQQPKTMVLS